MRNSRSQQCTKETPGNGIERTYQTRRWLFPLLGVTCLSQYYRIMVIVLLYVLQCVQCDGGNNSKVPDNGGGSENMDKIAHVNGFLHVVLYPPVLHVTLGKTAIGYVNISLDETVLGEMHWMPTVSNPIVDEEGKPTSTNGINGNLKHSDPEDKPSNSRKIKSNQEGNGISKVATEQQQREQKQRRGTRIRKIRPKPPATGADGNITQTQLYIVTTSNSTEQTNSHGDQIPQMPSSHNEANRNQPNADDQNNLGANWNKVDKLDPYRVDYRRIISSIGITSCCINDNIAYMVTSNGDLTHYNASKSFTVTVEGISLGRTSIKFKVKRNATLSGTSEHAQERMPGASSTDSATTWWLPYEYDVIVTKSPNQAPFYLSAVLFGKTTTISNYFYTMLLTSKFKIRAKYKNKNKNKRNDSLFKYQFD